MEEESFIILGTSPTPSMENYRSRDFSLLAQQSIAGKRQLETSTQLDSQTYSLLAEPSTEDKPTAVESSLAPAAIVAKPETDVDLRSVGNSINDASNQLAASFILGETRSLLQQFPSLASSAGGSGSAMSLDEVKVLQKLCSEHSLLKESLQKANMAMRKNFTSVQRLQSEMNRRNGEQDSLIAEQRTMLEERERENDALKEQMAAKDAEIEKLCRAVEEAGTMRQAELTSAAAEVEELRKTLSERQSIIQNMARQIEKLELQMHDIVMVEPNKPAQDDGQANFIPLAEHKAKVKELQREMSVLLAKNLDFEDMRKTYCDEIDCLKANAKAAEKVTKTNAASTEMYQDQLNKRDLCITELQKELKGMDEKNTVLTAQLEIYRSDFEAERTARQDLASAKDRLTTDFQLLQMRNQQLIDEVQNGLAERERAAQAAARQCDDRSEGQSSAASVPEQQSYQRYIQHCPLCQKGFKDLGSLQNHVEDCVGVD